MSLEVLVKTRLILLDDFLVLLFGLGGPGLMWMISEPALSQRVTLFLCDWEDEIFTIFGR